MDNQFYNKMTQTPVQKLILKLAVPTIISMLITSFYNMVDTFFIGKINTSATGAIGIVFSFTAIIQAISFFFGHGSGNYLSRKLGEKDYEQAERMCITGFLSAFIVGFVIMIFGIIFLKPLALLLGSTKTILPYTMDYLKVILFGVPFTMASFVLNNQLRFQGKAVYGTIGMGTGAVLNIILDPIFIFTFNMNIMGAALATVISQFISFLLLFYGCLKNGEVKLNFRKFTPKFSYYKEIARGGFPSLCRQGIASIGMICLNFAAEPYGDEAIAAMSIVSRIMFFGMAAIIGFGQGFQPVCGFNYGAKRYDRVKEAFWFCVKFSCIFLLIISILGFIFSEDLVRLFRKEDLQVIEYGAEALRYQCITFVLMSWITISNMMLQTMGKVIPASFLAMGRQGILFIPLVFIFPHLFGATGLFLIQPVADILTFLVAIPLQLTALKKLQLEATE